MEMYRDIDVLFLSSGGMWRCVRLISQEIIPGQQERIREFHQKLQDANRHVVFRSLYERELAGNVGLKFYTTMLPWERELFVFCSQPNSIASN